MKEKEKYKPGDLVVINQEDEHWQHLKEKEVGHPLTLQGVVTEVREVTYVVKFAGYVAYLKASDLVKLS